ncbi:MAG: BMP family ABC transporter substrate-binding protein [Deltaproteobacteria bacterium]|jgi:basic membrane protein A|nr:BMP family ABC transporter substrate-binding protein [Deltaproteobacteria bacterium]
MSSVRGFEKSFKRGLRLPLVVLPIVLCACTKKSDFGASAEEKKATSGMSIGLVLDKGGKDDKSFNSAAVAGAERAAKEFGLTLKDVESPDDAAFEPAMRTFAERGIPLIIAVGFAQADALKKVAPQFPNTHFAIVDSVVNGPNVSSLMFEEHEGSYLVGYLAGLATKTGKVGFVGGMDVALVRRFLIAYEAGVAAANPKVKVMNGFVGITASAWANPTRGRELALSQMSQGADVLFAAAGASGIGVFDAVETDSSKKTLVIGVDSNQNGIKPGRVLTSMLKRVDNAVYEAIKSEVEKNFKAGTQSFGLIDKGIDYAVDEHNKTLIAPYQEKLEAVRAQIISGAVKVPDFYKMKEVK